MSAGYSIRSSPKNRSASSRSRYHCSRSIGGSWRNSSCISRPVFRLFGETPCGTRSAIGLPLRVTVTLSPAAPAKPGLLSRLGHRRAVTEARARFDSAFAVFDQARSDAVAAHRIRVQQVRYEHRDRVDALVAAAHGGDPDAAPELAAAVLETVGPLRDLLTGGRGVHRPEAQELVVEVELPGKEVIPAEREWRYVVGRRTVDSRVRPAREIAALYQDVVAQATLATLLVVFRAFPSELVDVVTVNAHVHTTDPATGNPTHPCLVTVSAPRSTVAGLQLDNPELDAVECMHRLGAEISPNPYTAAAVTPFLDLDVLERYRLVTRPEDLAALDHRADLLEMDPYRFEALVVVLFAALGYRTWRTRNSHDDGGGRLGCLGRPAPAGGVPHPGQAHAQPGQPEGGAGPHGRAGREPHRHARLPRDDVVVQRPVPGNGGWTVGYGPWRGPSCAR